MVLEITFVLRLPDLFLHFIDLFQLALDIHGSQEIKLRIDYKSVELCLQGMVKQLHEKVTRPIDDITRFFLYLVEFPENLVL